MKGNEFATIASRFDSSDPELSDYRFCALVNFADTRRSSFYDLLEALKYLSEDPSEKREHLEYLIGEARREHDILQMELEKLKKEDE